jgi:hypothetical protein
MWRCLMILKASFFFNIVSPFDPGITPVCFSDHDA